MAKGVNYWTGSQWAEVAAVEQSDGNTAPVKRWDGSQWVEIFSSFTLITNGLVSRYTFEDTGDATTITDSHGTHDLSVTGTFSYTADSTVEGSYVGEFGTEGFGGGGADLGADPSFTICLWIDADSMQDFARIAGQRQSYNLLGQWSGDGEWGALTRNSSGDRSFAQESFDITGSAGYNFLAVRYDAGANELSAYRDGSVRATNSSANAPQDETNNFSLGGDGGGSDDVDGRIDDARLYDRALSDSELDSIYSGGG